MKVHAKGISTIIFFSLFIILTGLAITVFCTMPDWIEMMIWVVLGIIVVLFSMFFRVPKRQAFIDPNAIISAADGKVVAIETMFEKEYFREPRIQISVFMSIYNVHVNYTPVAGEVVYKKHHPGKNYPAINPKSSELNEMYSTVIKSEKLSVMIRQIAGIAARRIFVKPDVADHVPQSSELGLIKLGSRVDIFLPESVRINVKIGDMVIAGQSVLAWID